MLRSKWILILSSVEQNQAHHNPFFCELVLPMTVILLAGKSYELVQAAEKSLEGPNYSYGIEACSEVLDGNGPEIGTKLKHDCLSTRAALFLKLITLVKLLQRSSTQASKSLVHGEEILITEPCKSAHVATAKAAKDAGVFLSYDRILSRFVEGLIMLIFLKWSNAVE
ncbi:uncharacterized protein LOC131237425 isoform X6 [Magnolia sinica]|uniref:uncharacterized protein LOC131237425 isoform X6 n=1 Tax=Magnolia sinica TaxID=86752 RepID=UPI002659E523|nr:uncharacterized protein LOC131237425 isoform X6 [Magnolia sinica]XP_058091218.1 uncharacterized protein LOC131237425 isoform X6 [Magnolia sinica]